MHGIDTIFGGHAHDGLPVAVLVRDSGGTTLVTNAGSNSKFIGVTDFDVKAGQVTNLRYRLMPIFANQLKADPQMQALITKVRAPFEAKLSKKAGCHRRPAVPARQFQWQLGPADLRRTDGHAGCRDRVLAWLSLGHAAAAGWRLRRNNCRLDRARCEVRDLLDHAEEPQLAEGAVHSGGRVQAIGCGAHRQVAEAERSLHQTLTGWRGRPPAAHCRPAQSVPLTVSGQ